MLLTITYNGKNASDFGFLLHKHPQRPQQFAMSFGEVYVFYPAVEENTCTAALLLDINPVDLARGKQGAKSGGLFDYINDRPYVSSSFMSTAIANVFSTAMSGRCDKKPELAAQPLSLEANLSMLPFAGDIERINSVFEPLGYSVEYTQYPLCDAFPQWGESRYINLKFAGQVRLCDLLNHLYVLIPVFDGQKHYWMGENEIQKLLSHGEGWLRAHPEKKYITRRYFFKMKRFAFVALEQLIDEEEVENTVEDTALEEAENTVLNTAADAVSSAAENTASDEELLAKPPDIVREKRVSLNNQRLNAVMEAVRASGASTVLDLGCGEGKLTERLARDPQIKKITAMDISMCALRRLKQRIRHMPPTLQDKITVTHGALTYQDTRLEGHDVACLIEVIEHMDASRLPALERVVFEFAAPKTIIVTTPNVEYNKNYAFLSEGDLRHFDHRFEWTRAQFREWAAHVAQRFSYRIQFHEIGERDEERGAPTQMGVFTKCV